MRGFLLDDKPNFNESTTVVDGTKFQLRNVRGNGTYFIEYSDDDTPIDQVCLTKQAMKALYLLLSTK